MQASSKSTAQARDPADLAALGVIRAKTQPPRPSAAEVVRADVLARLDAVPAPAVLVSAPAGFGKTTAIRQWVERDERPYAWVTIDAADDDPVVLLRHIVLALDAVAPMATAWPIVTTRGSLDARSALPAVAADLAAHGEPFVLVLDDHQEITAEPARQLVERLLDVVPDGSTVAITSRTPPAHAVRRELAGTLVRVDADALRMPDSDAEHLLHEICPELDDTLASSVVARCDGWTAGLALAALALRRAPDPAQLVTGMATASRPIADYLQEELLDGLSDDERSFLVGGSVLDLLHGDLCNAVLQRDDGHEMLHRLASSGNLLIAELDDSGTWYRYHRLLRDALLAELRASDAVCEPELRRRAAGWLADRGFTDEAVRQLLGAGARAEAAACVAAEIRHLVLDGRTATLQRWIAHFSVEEIRSTPGLILVAAWAAALSARRDETDHWLRCLDEVDPTTVLPDGTTVRTSRAAIEMFAGAGGTAGVIAAADLLTDLGPTGSPWWTSARLLGAAARHAAGQLADPATAFADVATDGRSDPAVRAVALAQRALVLLRTHQVEDGHRAAGEARAYARDHGLDDYPVLLTVHAVVALDAAIQGDPRTATEEARRADEMQSLVAAGPRARVLCQLILAETSLRLDDLPGAATRLRVALADLTLEPDAAEYHRWAADLQRRLAGRADTGGIALTVAERRLLELLPTHLPLAEIASRLYVSRNTVKTQSIAIYRKLGVSSRSDAVHRARELGLLAE